MDYKGFYDSPDYDTSIRDALANIVRGLKSPEQWKAVQQSVQNVANVAPSVGESLARGAIGQIPGTPGDISATARQFAPQTMQNVFGQRSMPTTEEILAQVPRVTPTYQGSQQHETVGSVTGPALAKLLKMGAQATKGMPVGNMIAYHGTPHEIKGGFDISKVGTGEGQQSYGHGMYFAESPSVANAYKGSDEVRILANGQITESPVAKNIIRYGGNPQAFIDSLQGKVIEQTKALEKASKEEVLPGLSDYDIAKIDLDSTLKKIEEAKSYKTVETQPIGNLYKVDIPDEYIPTMMDWDKPLGQQSAIVKKAVESIKKRITPEMKDELGGDLNLLFGKDVTPNQFLNTLEIIHPESTVGIGEQWLNEAGVKGMRYLDNTSVAKGQGTSNFVVFDPKEVKILEKNSKAVKNLLEEQFNKLEK